MDKIEKLAGRPLDEKLRIIYEWVKSNHINYKEFCEMISFLVLYDFEMKDHINESR